MAPRKRPIKATRAHFLRAKSAAVLTLLSVRESSRKGLTPNADSGRVAVAGSIPRPSPGWCARRNPASHLQRTLKKIMSALRMHENSMCCTKYNWSEIQQRSLPFSYREMICTMSEMSESDVHCSRKFPRVANSCADRKLKLTN